jgi:protein TIF31
LFVEADSSQEVTESLHYVDIDVITPENNDSITIAGVSIHEPIGILRQLLSEFIETAFYTTFHFAVKSEMHESQEVQYTTVVDFQEISSIVETPAAKLVLCLRYDDYDVKQARSHVKKFRDTIANPPMAKGSKFSPSNASDNELISKSSAASKQQEAIAMIPSPENLIAPLKLKDFYEEVLFRASNNHQHPSNSVDGKGVQLTDVIKSVSLSAYNPPPANRRAFGDLLYLEVNIAEEGTIFITASASGFFVNSSNRASFDPRPSSMHPQLAHELFHLLSQISSAFRNRWQELLKHIDVQQRAASSAGLDLIASLFQHGKGDQVSFIRQWNSYFSEHSKHSLDANRLHDDLTDNYGIDDRGAAREWNDEIQPIRDMKVSNIQEKVTKAKFCQKVGRLGYCFIHR